MSTGAAEDTARVRRGGLCDASLRREIGSRCARSSQLNSHRNTRRARECLYRSGSCIPVARTSRLAGALLSSAPHAAVPVTTSGAAVQNDAYADRECCFCVPMVTPREHTPSTTVRYELDRAGPARYGNDGFGISTRTDSTRLIRYVQKLCLSPAQLKDGQARSWRAGRTRHRDGSFAQRPPLCCSRPGQNIAPKPAVNVLWRVIRAICSLCELH